MPAQKWFPVTLMRALLSPPSPRIAKKAGDPPRPLSSAKGLYVKSKKGHYDMKECSAMLKTDDFEDITRIMLGRDVNGSVYWVAAYYVDGLLIDTGCRFTAHELIDYLENKSIDVVVNTHFHEDHIGANKLVQEKFDLDIYAHPDSIPLINKKAAINPYQEVVWGYPEPSETKPIPRRISTRRYAFDVYETPGHSVGHVSLLEPERGWCFSGDIFISENQKVIRPDEDVYQIIDSLKLIRELGSGKLTLFTSIGQVFEDGRKSISSYLDYIDDLRKRVQELNQNGLTPEEIRDRIFSRESQLAKLTNGHYSILNLITSLVDGLSASPHPL